MAGARAGITGAVVAAGALQAAGGPVAPLRAGWRERQVGLLLWKCGGHRGGPRALACFRGPGAGPPACPAGSDTHPARSAAPSSPGRRSSCRWPGGTGPRFCRHTSVHSSRQTGSGDSLQTEAVLGALAYGYTCSETHPHQVRHALNKRFPGPPGPVSAPEAHGYQGAMPSPPSFQSAQARPDPEPRVIRGKGAWALQGL